MKIIFFGLALGLIGCASGGRGEAGSKEGTFRMPFSDDASAARGEAFAGDLSIRKDMPAREPKYKPFDFYYKRCSLGSSETYSSRAYDCNMPGF